VCSAQELSELITKLLNKLYTQQEFKVSGQVSKHRTNSIGDDFPSSGGFNTSGVPSAGSNYALSLELAKPSVLG
jgi:hypothetical protein